METGLFLNSEDPMLKVRKVIILLALAGLLSVSSFAGGTGKIAGKIVDAETGNPLPGALISVVGSEKGAISDDAGYYFIINLMPGNYTIKATMIGYQATTVLDVRCNPDLTTRINIRMKPSPITTEGVTITAKRPIVEKDLTATLRVIPAEDLRQMPWDNIQQAVAAQTGVVRLGEELHLRGGRSDEVDYLIDGLSVKDPTEGYTGLLVNTNALSELSLMTGVYNVEYGEAMSGVIQASVKDGSQAGFGVQLNSGTLFDSLQGRGWRSIQVNAGRDLWQRRLTVFGAGDISLTDDWDPHRQMVPHQGREDYSWLSKVTLSLPLQIRTVILAAGSRSQYGRYNHDWYFSPKSYRSDLRRGNLISLSINQSLSKSAFYQLKLGRFWNQGRFGVQDTFWDIGRHWWEDIRFIDYMDNQIYYDLDSNLVFTAGYNPYGYDRTLFYRYGNYWQYRNRTTEERFLKADLIYQVSRLHQLKAGISWSWYWVDNFHLYSTALGKPIMDAYRRYPNSQAVYLHDKLEYEGLVVNGGIRFQRLDPSTSDIDSGFWSSNLEQASLGPRWALSPRLGLSYVVSTTTTFRFGYGRFFQMPLFQQLYQYITSQGTQQIKGNILGNPALKPPRTTSIEFGTVTELTPELSLDLAVYYKEVKDLISVNYVPALPNDYYQYVNLEQANSTGIEVALRKHFGKHLLGSIRYSLSKAVGTGSDPTQVLAQHLAQVQGESLGVMERKEIPLDFDQRNKLVAEISVFNREDTASFWYRRLLRDYSLNLMFHYGSGLPYTPVVLNKLNQESPAVNSERYPASKQLDLRLVKHLPWGRLQAGLFLEIINLFDWQNLVGNYSREIGPYDAYANDWQPQPPQVDYLSNSPYYDAEGDANGDGVFTVDEQWNRWIYFIDLHEKNPLLTGQPRLWRMGLQFTW